MRLYNKGILIVLLGLCVLGACKKKEVVCYDSVYEIPVYISFVGFPLESLDTVIVAEYPVGDNFTNSISIDTILSYGLTIKNDTSSILYRSSDWPYQGFNETEHKIFLSGESDTFYIKDAKYMKPRRFLAEENCGSARQHAAGPSEININGLIINSISYNHCIYLKK